jgi:hypothetical protein
MDGESKRRKVIQEGGGLLKTNRSEVEALSGVGLL